MSESQTEQLPEKSEQSFSGGNILFDRLWMIGENFIPREEFKNVSGEDFNLFMTEPDPGKFPPSLQHLWPYLAAYQELSGENEEAEIVGEF